MAVRNDQRVWVCEVRQHEFGVVPAYPASCPDARHSDRPSIDERGQFNALRSFVDELQLS